MHSLKFLAFLVSAILTVSATAQIDIAAHTQLKNSKIDINSTSLVLYASQGDLSMVSLLVRAGVSPSESEPQRKVTAFHAATTQGHLKVIASLLKSGALINAEDMCGYTPLMVAAYFGQSDAVSMLVRNGGVLLDHQAHCGLTPLIAAVQSANIKIVDTLLAAGAKPQMQDVFGNTALKTAQQSQRNEIAARIQAALMAQ